MQYLFLTQFLASEAKEAASIYDNLQTILSTQQGEMALFARELRQVCASILNSFLFWYFSGNVLSSEHFWVRNISFFYCLNVFIF